MNTSGINPYKILNLNRNANLEQIKSSYRKLALKYHPDHNKDSTSSSDKQFIEIGIAYQILKDPKKRKKFDAFGIIDSELGVNSEETTMESFLHRYKTVLMNEMKAKKFGPDSTQIQRTLQRGYDPFEPDIYLSIFLGENDLNKEINIHFIRNVPCPDCDKDCSDYQCKCKKCDGTGYIGTNLCSSCGGKGFITKKCPKCGGKTYLEISDSILIKIPENKEDTEIQTVTIEGKGHVIDKGWDPGNLIVIFKRKN